jgi:hypothetical protein
MGDAMSFLRRSPYDPPGDNTAEAILLPSGALAEPHQLALDREFGRRQEEELARRQEEREAAAAQAQAEKTEQLLADLRNAGVVLPPG